MERHYVPLRSAPASGDAPELSNSSPSLLAKRRRVGVSIACNRCRRRKIRCDGKRPVCANCIGQTDLCEYREDSDLRPESKKIVIEIIQLLNCLPAAQLRRVLEQLRTETNAATIMALLRDEAALAQESSGDFSTVVSPYEASGRTEFESRYPTAYPVIRPFDLEDVGERWHLGHSRDTEQNLPQSGCA